MIHVWFIREQAGTPSSNTELHMDTSNVPVQLIDHVSSANDSFIGYISENKTNIETTWSQY